MLMSPPRFQIVCYADGPERIIAYSRLDARIPRPPAHHVPSIDARHGPLGVRWALSVVLWLSQPFDFRGIDLPYATNLRAALHVRSVLLVRGYPANEQDLAVI